MHRRPQRSRAGFSLIELLVSMGIMVIGLVMAGTLFPAAIKQTSRSTDDTIGTIICQNALAVAKARLTHTSGANPVDGLITTVATSLPGSLNFVNLTPPQTLTVTPLLTEAELAYPAPRTPISNYDGSIPTNPRDWWGATPNFRPTTNYGAIVLARQVRDDIEDENDYQLVVISYKKKVRVTGLEPHQNIVIAEAFDVSLRNDMNEDFTRIDLSALAGADQKKFLKGSAIILDDDVDGAVATPNDKLYGTFAKLKMINGTEGRLDVRLPEGPAFFVPGVAPPRTTRVWVVYEADSANNPVGNTSPTMSIFTTRTALND